MKALILSGGKGTRLRPITYTASKQLVPIANKPILFYVIEHMVDAGITDIGIVVGDTAEEVMAAVGDGSRWGVTFTFLRQDAPSGLAHAVYIAREFLGQEPFVMYLGDNLVHGGVTKYVEQFLQSRATEKNPNGVSAQILLSRVPDPHRFGVAELDDKKRVVRLVEKPKDPQSDLALVGVYLFNPVIHDAVRAIRPSARGELEITDAIQWIIDLPLPVSSEVIEGYWKDLGELEAILDGNSVILENIEHVIEGKVDKASQVDQRVRVELGAKIVNSKVRGPAIIGRNSVIVDSYIGPYTAIGANCTVTNAEVEHAMVLDNAELNRCGRIEDSLIGQAAKVTRSELKPIATRLMIGDNSVVDLG